MDGNLGYLADARASALFSFIIGLPIGVPLYMAARSTSGVVRFGYSILSFIVNILRSVPFIILIVAMIPITKSLVGVSVWRAGNHSTARDRRRALLRQTS